MQYNGLLKKHARLSLADSVGRAALSPPQNTVSAGKKQTPPQKIRRSFRLPRGSAYKIQSAEQIDKNREHVSRFLYFERDKSFEQELLSVRVLRSQNTSCRKTEFCDKSAEILFSNASLAQQLGERLTVAGADDAAVFVKMPDDLVDLARERLGIAQEQLAPHGFV